jgi:hypothetical protein
MRLIAPAIWLMLTCWANAAPVPVGKGSGIPTELPVPANAAMIIQLNDYSRLVDHLKTMLIASFGKDGEKFWAQLNEMDKNEGSRAQLQWKGLTKGDRVYFAIMSLDFNAEEPPFLAMFPVDDAKAFRTSLFPPETVESTEKGSAFETIKLKDGETIYCVESKSRVYMCGSKELAETVSKPFESFKSKSLGDSVAPFFGNDLSYWLNIEAVREKYADEIQQFKAVIPLIMQQGAGQLDKQQLNSAKQILELIFQLLEDGKGLVIGLSLKPDGVGLGFHAAFGANTPSGKATVVEKPSSLDALAKLPAGFTIYTGNSLSPRAAQAFAKLYRDFAPADDDKEGRKAFESWNAVAFDATSTASAMNMDRTSLSAAQHPAAEKSVQGMIAAMKSVGEGMRYQNIPLKGKPVVVENDKTFAGVGMHKISLTFDFEAYANAQPEPTREATIASVKKLLPETLTMWVGSKADLLVQVAAKEWATAEEILKKTFAGTETVGRIAGSKLTRGGLPAEVGAVSLIDTGRLIEFGADYAKTMFGSLPGLPFDADQIKIAKPKGEPTYLGFSFTMSGNTGAVDLFLPHRSMGMVYEAIKPMIDSGMMP